MKKIIFITGAAGMVGSNLIRQYINKKNIIISIDNLVLGKEIFLKLYKKKKNFFFYKKDLSKKIISNEIPKILKKNILSEVWLLAANSDIQKGTNDYRVDLKNTFLSTIYTMEFLKKYINKNTKIMFTSSSAIYGNIKKEIDENTTKMSPISNYGSMKLASEGYLSSFSNANKANVLIFRFPNVIGDNLTHGLLFDMKNKIQSKKKYIQVLGNGEQQKPYSHVKEIIKCMLFLKNKKLDSKLNYFNIGTNDNGIKVKNIVKEIVKKFNSKKKIIYEKNNTGWVGDVPKYKYSTKKIKKLGFKFRYDSQKAIKLTINSLS